MLTGGHINDFHFTCGDKIGLNVRKRVRFKYLDCTDSFVEASNDVWKTKACVVLLQKSYKNTNFRLRKNVSDLINKCKHSCPCLKARISSIEIYLQSQHLNLQSEPTEVHLQRNCYYNMPDQQVET